MPVVQEMATKLVLLLVLASAVIGIDGKSLLPYTALNDQLGPDGSPINGTYALVAPKMKWPNGIVPWEYKAGNTFTDDQKKVIELAMQQLSKATCIKFKAKTTETAFVQIQNGKKGCNAVVGYYEGEATSLNLANGCFRTTIPAMHEMMHSLGFSHEQSRYDRDMYLDIQWSNIKAGMEHNFVKQPRTKSYPRYPYDLFSIMQYVLTGFSIDGRPTMILTNPVSESVEGDIGNPTELSKSDILRIRSAYKCDFSGESGGVGRAHVKSGSNVAEYNFF